MAFPTRIYLTGFMGSGKSTIGPMVANVLGYAFMDLDDAIEAEIGGTIADFFAARGEGAFREVEADLLRRTGGLHEHVVALGGGALAREDNLRFAREHGVIVYLKWSPESLARRLGRSADRPLLHDEQGRVLDPPALLERIRGMLARREAFYEQAHIVVPLDGSSVGWSVDSVVKALRKWRRAERRRAWRRKR